MLSYHGLTGLELWRLFRWWTIHVGPKRDVTVDTSNGVLTFDSRNWLIGKYLYVKRAHEENEIRSALELLVAEGLMGRCGNTIYKQRRREHRNDLHRLGEVRIF